MATMGSLIGLVNRIQRACTVLGDHGGGAGGEGSLWEALPSVAVVGGQVRAAEPAAFASRSTRPLHRSSQRARSRFVCHFF
jgi:hypothetical protein